MIKETRKKGKRSRLGTASLALAVAVGLSLLAPGFSAAAYNNEVTAPASVPLMTRAVKTELSVRGISNIKTSAYKAIPIKLGNQAVSVSALVINGINYVPVRSIIEKIDGISVTYNSKTKTLTTAGMGLNLSATDGAYVVYANDRALFEMSPARVMSDGRMYIPANTMAKALGLKVSISGGELVLSGTPRALTHASRFYDADSVYWLSKIISAESKGEPLLGQIAVGNVVLNRVKSKSYPNTIWGVIFDKKYGVQFSPVANGTIYDAPTYTATLAAKICLEGFSISNEILCFVAPRYAPNSWISKNCTYEFTIQNHEFYS